MCGYERKTIPDFERKIRLNSKGETYSHTPSEPNELRREASDLVTNTNLAN